MESVIEDKYIGQRLDSVVHSILEGIGNISLTRSLIQNYIEKGCSVNGNICKKAYRFKEGDVIYIDEKYWLDINNKLDLSKEILPQKGDLDIRYEDKELIVLYKQKNLVVHPGVGNSDRTLANFIRYYLESKNEYDGLLDKGGIVHRLDKGVSGLMVVAKNKHTQEYLRGLFKRHEVIKIYHAYLEESNEYKNIDQDLDIEKYLERMNIDIEPWKKWEKVEGYIGRSSRDRYKMEFKRYEFDGSKYALSYVLYSNNQALIKIETGRMHQIRATLKYLGLHIKGDSLYAEGRVNSNSIMLEEVLLSFVKENGNRLTFKV